MRGRLHTWAPAWNGADVRQQHAALLPAPVWVLAKPVCTQVRSAISMLMRPQTSKYCLPTAAYTWLQLLDDERWSFTLHLVKTYSEAMYPLPHARWHSTLFFLLVGAGGLISFCKIRRHMRVMFSTTTGVLMFTAMRKRLRAGEGQESQSVHMGHLFSEKHPPRWSSSSPQRKRSSQQLSSLEMESVRSSISY